MTEEEYERLNAGGHAGADMGCYPIGSCCLKKVAKIVPGFKEKFVVTMEGA